MGELAEGAVEGVAGQFAIELGESVGEAVFEDDLRVIAVDVGAVAGLRAVVGEMPEGDLFNIGFGGRGLDDRLNLHRPEGWRRQWAGGRRSVVAAAWALLVVVEQLGEDEREDSELFAASHPSAWTPNEQSADPAGLELFLVFSSSTIVGVNPDRAALATPIDDLWIEDPPFGKFRIESGSDVYDVMADSR